VNQIFFKPFSFFQFLFEPKVDDGLLALRQVEFLGEKSVAATSLWEPIASSTVFSPDLRLPFFRGEIFEFSDIF